MLPFFDASFSLFYLDHHNSIPCNCILNYDYETTYIQLTIRETGFLNTLQFLLLKLNTLLKN